MAKKILLVDDEEDILKTNRLMLTESNYNVITASNGKDAIKKTEAQNPDLILLDIMMPGMDGLQTLTKLKNKPDTSSIPVIMLSGVGEESTWNKAKLMGAADCLTKPFNLEMLLEVIKKHMPM